MKRRAFSTLAGAVFAALALHAPASFAQSLSSGIDASPSGVVVVELINLACPRCRAVNAHVDDLQAAARDAGMGFRVAPIAYSTQSAWPDRVYYAARDSFPGSEVLIRSVLFQGIQDQGLPFEDLPQVISYLESQGVPKKLMETIPDFRLSDVAGFAASDVPLMSEVKAAKLVTQTMAQEVPVFVWVKDGKVIDSVSPAQADDPMQLFQLVLGKLRSKPAPAQPTAPVTNQRIEALNYFRQQTSDGSGAASAPAIR